MVAAWLVGAYLVARAVLEPFVIDVTDPDTYEDDWGGPSLAGVLLVHCGPGIVAAGLMVRAIRNRQRRRSRPSTRPLSEARRSAGGTEPR